MRRNPLQMIDAAEVLARKIALELVMAARWRGEFDGDLRRLHRALTDLAQRRRNFPTKLANLRHELRRLKAEQNDREPVRT